MPLLNCTESCIACMFVYICSLHAQVFFIWFNECRVVYPPTITFGFFFFFLPLLFYASVFVFSSFLLRLSKNCRSLIFLYNLYADFRILFFLIISVCVSLSFSILIILYACFRTIDNNCFAACIYPSYVTVYRLFMMKF